MALFSIITVTYNPGNLLLHTRNSIEAQTFRDYEWIIKDGMSSDNSLKNIEDSETTHVFVSRDTGIYDAMNQAIDLAIGQYFIFMNAGDVFASPDVLQKTADFITENNMQEQNLIIFGGWKMRDKYYPPLGGYHGIFSILAMCVTNLFFTQEVFLTSMVSMIHRIRFALIMKRMSEPLKTMFQHIS